MILSSSRRVILPNYSRFLFAAAAAARRTLVSRPPGADPLDVLMKECMARNLCDETGSRLPGVHWVLALALSPKDLSMPPNLRTVGIERISPQGVDFVLKRFSPTAESIAAGGPVSFLHQQGHFVAGEHAEQWRGEGSCEQLGLGSVLDLIPHFTVTNMVASTRIAEEEKEKEQTEKSSNEQSVSSANRRAMLSRSHVTEVMQKTRVELENGDIPFETLNQSIAAFRFQPNRIECMLGGPDTVMWDRWEWMRGPHDTDGDWHDAKWDEPTHLLPH